MSFLFGANYGEARERATQLVTHACVEWDGKKGDV
jgi:ribosomal protein S4